MGAAVSVILNFGTYLGTATCISPPTAAHSRTRGSEARSRRLEVPAGHTALRAVSESEDFTSGLDLRGCAMVGAASTG